MRSLVKNTVVRLVDNANSNFPLMPAHEWYKLNMNGLSAAVHKYAKCKCPEDNGFQILNCHSDKRKELFIAYNAKYYQDNSKSPFNFLSVNRMYELPVNSLPELIDTLFEMGIKSVTGNDCIEMEGDALNFNEDEMNYVLAYNHYAIKMQRSEAEEATAIQSQRVRFGLVSGDK
ncbi:hypothetical protein LMH73_009105 [Vibrio splendidus]|nr:hypothetical protein [Vibrio splendidus]MCC4880318.1 hypothetical protein [Vibrio splendidus]